MKTQVDMMKLLYQLSHQLYKYCPKMGETNTWLHIWSASFPLLHLSKHKQANLLKLSDESLNNYFPEAFGNLSMNCTDEQLHRFCCPFPQCATGILFLSSLTIKPGAIHDCKWKNISNKKLTPGFPAISGIH